MVEPREFIWEDLPKLLAFLMQGGGDEHVGDLQWALRFLVELWVWGDAGYSEVDAGRLVVQASNPDTATRMLDHGIARAAARGERRVEIEAIEGDEARLALLRSRGFERAGAGVVELWRALDDLPAPEPPSGFALRGYRAEDADAYVAMHRDAWSDRRPSTYTPEAHRRVTSMPGFDPELVPIAIAPDGALAAYCICWLDPVREYAEIEPLGTRPAFRRLGLARAVVLEALRRMKAAGARAATVWGVEANEAAMRLYTGCGFAPRRRVAAYAREV